MSRTDGLVQRKIAAPPSSGAREEGWSHLSSDEEDGFNKKSYRDKDEDDEDHDSKETRLTLMEEILLLGLKDKEVIDGFVVVENFSRTDD